MKLHYVPADRNKKIETMKMSGGKTILEMKKVLVKQHRYLP